MIDSLGDFEQLVLFAIIRLGDDAYGVAIRDVIEERTGRSINSGAIYTALNRMERRGLVSSWEGEPVEQRGGRRKRFYAVESEGADMLQRSYEATRRMAQGQTAKLASLAERAP
jgi:PadR family transcriptional regulator